ncbi:hypothetical protein OH77DRAFT_1317395 [Trametes cingulata]|nr:hypothetical protein OH77DRAFT_1317395 [Trametes cingulata]
MAAVSLTPDIVSTSPYCSNPIIAAIGIADLRPACHAQGEDWPPVAHVREPRCASASAIIHMSYAFSIHTRYWHMHTSMQLVYPSSELDSPIDKPSREAPTSLTGMAHGLAIDGVTSAAIQSDRIRENVVSGTSEAGWLTSPSPRRLAFEYRFIPSLVANAESTRFVITVTFLVYCLLMRYWC